MVRSEQNRITANARLISALADMIDWRSWPDDVLTSTKKIREACDEIDKQAREHLGGNR